MTSSGKDLLSDWAPTTPIKPVWPRDQGVSDRRWLLLRVAGAVAMGLWLVGLVALSTLLYRRFFVSEDFGTYTQAWTLIGQGHLNPFDTIQGYPFVKNDFELMMWPLALLHLVYPQPVVLLWVQDATAAGSGLVVYLWIVDYLEQRKIAWSTAAGVALAMIVVVVANPGIYLLSDFHLETITTLFLLLAGRDLWSGRHRRAWIWAAGALLCGSFAALTVVGLGLSAILAGRATRRQGILLILAAGVWLGLISILGMNVGASLSGFAYLAGRTTLPPTASFALIAVGTVSHPSLVFHQLHIRLHSIYLVLKPTGVIGLASAWGFGVPAVVLLSSALSANPIFIFEAFQNFAVFGFVLFGTVTVLVWLAQRFRFGWIPVVVVAVALFVQAVLYGASTSPNAIRWSVSQIGPGKAAQVGRALSMTPPGAQVISSMRVMGRFSARKYVYTLLPRTFPVQSRQVVFVIIPTLDTGVVSPVDDAAVIASLRTQLHARTIVDADGVLAFEWLPPRGTTRITLPTAHPSTSPLPTSP